LNLSVFFFISTPQQCNKMDILTLQTCRLLSKSTVDKALLVRKSGTKLAPHATPYLPKVRNECKNLAWGIFTTLLGDFIACSAQLLGTFFISQIVENIAGLTAISFENFGIVGSTKNLSSLGMVNSSGVSPSWGW
jgi:hypothetical protein